MRQDFYLSLSLKRKIYAHVYLNSPVNEAQRYPVHTQQAIPLSHGVSVPKHASGQGQSSVLPCGSFTAVVLTPVPRDGGGLLFYFPSLSTHVSGVLFSFISFWGRG